MARPPDGDGGASLVEGRIMELLGDPLSAGSLLGASPSGLADLSARARAGSLALADIGLGPDDLRRAAAAGRRSGADPDVAAIRAATAAVRAGRRRILASLGAEAAPSPGAAGDGGDPGLGMR